MSDIQPSSLQGQYAGFISRLAAFVIDAVLINVTVFAATGLTVLMFSFFTDAFAMLPGRPNNAFESVAAIITGVVAIGSYLAMLFLYPILFWLISGQTIGKRAMGLRVVRMDGSRMTFWRGFARVLGYLLSALPLFLGFVWVIFNNERRGWHDLLADTCVIYSWEARDSAVLRTRLQQTGQQLAGSPDDS